MKYQANKIEKKWQKYWEDNNTFEAKDYDKREKFYGLVEFPFPSGEGLHTGHLRSYTAMDVICRKKRMQGFNVLFPMGMDAFGLPAENYAIKTNTHPQITTRKNIDNFVRQLKGTGFAFDWSRFISTTDPEYYKWTQWIFIQMFKKGLAYKSSENINWCTSCKIGLANEEVVAGACERCGGEVIKKEKEQWMLKITDYADRLIDGLDNINFLETIKKQQSDWIGKSEGAEIQFKVKSQKSKVSEELKVFTTRPDTLFGATFMVIAPEHPILRKLESDIKNISEIKEYIEIATKKTDIERASEDKAKTGIELKGLKAINPVNKEEIPIFVADYVMMGYGTGVIMAVPAHDQRDWEFAKKYNIEIREVISGGDISQAAYIEEGLAINSEKFNGLETEEFKEKIIKYLEDKKLGKATVNYKLHDWIFSRQRYWGEPIPMINCTKCGWLPVPEDDLPVELPQVDDFRPGDDGESPLTKATEWLNTTCPKCKGSAKRETDVMPNWAGSNWYFIRYTDPKNDKELVDRKKADYWLPVDWYNGGMEHNTLHLLYSRFVYKFLADINVVPKHKDIGDEPYSKRTAQGMILGEGGVKMSKSKGNVINPDGYLDKYGADTVRIYEMFMGPFDQSIAWDDKGVNGVYRFLNKVWDLQDKVVEKEISKEVQNLIHKSIKKVGEDIDNMRFNTAVSQMMILVNALDKESEISKEVFERFVLILAPFAPHMAEEMWQALGNKNSLASFAWPDYDKNLAQDDKVIIGIQVNGKVRDDIELDFDTEPSESLQAEILAREKVVRNIKDKEVVKFIHIRNKIISIVVK
ncbi:MAG: leucine--tRNA ligase [Candidatus Komeilibacteria bacterium]|nr:leucine--tRNA ligase [Candidatus Komeilibacteria bacterium]